jgi:hypothetical protein
MLRQDKNAQKNKVYESARRLFIAGSTINKSETTLFDNDIALLANVHPYRIPQAKLVAGKLNNDLKAFDELFKTQGIKSWNELYLHVTGKQTGTSDYSIAHWEKVLLKIINKHHLEPEQTYYYNVLARAYEKISKIIPSRPIISNSNFLAYFDCACCGQEAPSTGHRLIRYQIIPYIWFPRCEDCDVFQKEPDLMRLLRMYVSYTIDLDNTINTIEIGG